MTKTGSVHLDFVNVIEAACKAGVGPQEARALIDARLAIVESGLLISHAQAASLRALLLAVNAVLENFGHKRPGGAGLERLETAWRAHIKAVASASTLPRLTMAVTQAPVTRIRATRTDPLIGVANMGRD